MSNQNHRELLEEILLASRAMQNAADAVDGAVADLMGVNPTDLRCLAILDRLGTVPAGRLASEARLMTGAVTRVLDRLERARLVRRVADPADRRRVLVETTERARRFGSEAYGPIAEALLQAGQRCSPHQLEGILVFLELGRALNLRRAEEIQERVGARRRRRGGVSRSQPS